MRRKTHWISYSIYVVFKKSISTKIVYYSVGFTEPVLKFKQRISQSLGWGFANTAQNIYVDFLKPTLYNIFLIWHYQTYRKKYLIHTYYIFTRLLRGGLSGRVQTKTSLYVRFVSGIKKILQNIWET